MANTVMLLGSALLSATLSVAGAACCPEQPVSSRTASKHPRYRLILNFPHLTLLIFCAVQRRPDRLNNAAGAEGGAADGIHIGTLRGENTADDGLAL